MTNISIGETTQQVVDRAGQSCADTSDDMWPSPKSIHSIGDIWRRQIFRRQCWHCGECDGMLLTFPTNTRGPHWPTMHVTNHIYTFFTYKCSPLLPFTFMLSRFFRDVQRPHICIKKYQNWDLWQVSKMRLVWKAICDLYFRSDLLLNAQICVYMICLNTKCQMCFWYVPVNLT